MNNQKQCNKAADSLALDNRIIHQLPGRMRIYIRGIQKNPIMAQELEEYCRKITGINTVQAAVATGRVLILYDDRILTANRLLMILMECEQNLLFFQQVKAGNTDRVAVAKEQPQTFGALALQESWHTMASAEILEHLHSHEQQGLDMGEVQARYQYFGKNEIPEPVYPPWHRIFLRQFFNFTTFTMVSIAALPVFFGRLRDTGGILMLLGMNAVISTYQQQKAQKDIRSLKNLYVHKARVVRSGIETNLSASELVPGDIIVLEAGDRVPADAIILECWNAKMDESSLTGESLPAAKQAQIACDLQTPLAERKNMVYMGTFMTRGRAKVVVVATSEGTEIGKLIASLQHVKSRPTPLQKKLTVVAKTIVLSALAIAGVVVAFRFGQGYTVAETLLTGVSVATTAISEGLPIMITVALVAGMRRMVRHKVLVKEMSALETLAKVDVICTDKTGTLTKNEMTVKAIISGDHSWIVTGDGYQPTGKLYKQQGKEQKEVRLSPEHPVVWLSTLAALCNDADIEYEVNPTTGSKQAQVHGDPTEAALLVAAMKAGVFPKECRSRWDRVKEIPFDSDRRCMLVVCKHTNGDYIVCMKGSVDVVLEKCQYIKNDAGIRDLDPRIRTKVIEQEQMQAESAMRVLGIAFKILEQNPESMPPESMSIEELESELIFAGMFAMKDPPREQVRESIAVCQEAGIDIVMITGDHPVTAEAIGRELGIVHASGQILTGHEIAQMSDQELHKATQNVRIFSRIAPTDKQRIVQVLQQRGLRVAMIGDGVNDAPALKQADVGIALGTGTDAAKEASSLVLTNNDFTAVVKAIRQGRGVLGNIRSTIGYVFLGNLAEVLYAASVVVMGLPLSLMPMQMMFMNMLTDSLPTLLLTIGHPATQKNCTLDTPLPKVKDIFDHSFVARVTASGAITGLLTTAVFFIMNSTTGNFALASTMALATLCIGKLLQVPYWRVSAVGTKDTKVDPLMKFMLGIGLVGLLLAIYVPSLRFMFNSVPLGLSHWGIVLGAAFVGKKLTKPLTAMIETRLGAPIFLMHEKIPYNLN